MKTTNQQTFMLAIFTLVIGVALGALGVSEFIEVSREHPAVSLFLKGYTLLWIGVTLLFQHAQQRALFKAFTAATSPTASKSD